MAFVIIWSLFIRTSTHFQIAKKWPNSRFWAKLFKTFALFDKQKQKWKPKASKLFWQNFLK